MKIWTDFLRDVRPKAPGIPEAVAEHAVRRAAQDFCQQTRAWKAVLEPVLTKEGEKAYDIELDDNAELVRLESATLNGETYGIWRPGGEAHGAFVFINVDARTVEFSRGVEAGIPLVLTCSVKPGERSRGVPDAIHGRYVAVIALFAIAELTGDENKRAAYQARVDRIKTDLWRGQAAIRPRARANLF